MKESLCAVLLLAPMAAVAAGVGKMLVEIWLNRIYTGCAGGITASTADSANSRASR